MHIQQLLDKKTSNFVDSVAPTISLVELAQKLTALRVGALIVKDDDDTLLGIVSERDVMGVVAQGGGIERPVAEIMTKKVVTCEPEDEVVEVLHLMGKHTIRHMPVLSAGKLVGMVSIRELTMAYDLLEVEANTDPLTHLANRRAFLKALKAEAERGSRYDRTFSVAMIDIDHFKLVNDTYGHDAGDKVLQELAKVMIKVFRKLDQIGRLGGEEFAVLLPESELRQAKCACNRLIQAVRATDFDIGGIQVNITISIGLVSAPDTLTDVKQLLKDADALLYKAKDKGRDQLVTHEPGGPNLRVMSRR